MTQGELDRALIAAAWRNDVAETARLIGLGADVNAQDETVQSAYLIATSEGYLDLLRLTLDAGADVAAKDSYHGTGLIRAADRGHAEVIGVLLRAGIEVDHVNNLGWTALHEAIILGDGGPRYVDCVRLLLASGADPERVSLRDGVSPLAHAESRGFGVLATSLRRAIPFQRPADAVGALFEAAGRGDADGVMLALRAGADPVARDGAGSTAGEISAAGGHADVVRLLQALTAET